MGDMAEYCIQQGLDNYAAGDEEWDGYVGGGGCGPQPKTCRRCGASGLQWGQASGKWKLFGPGGEQHVCSVPAAKKAFK
jgi:hypothetical protein